MKKIIKFSKNIEDIFDIKKNLIKENNINLKKTLKINNEFKKLKKRKKCIICGYKLESEDFISHKVSYVICKKCSHLNGKHVMHKKFNEKIYSSNKGKNYSYLYTKLFLKRLQKIYNPKLKFIKNSIREKIKVLDFGCGAGHFVKACENNGIIATGIDPNKELIKTGNKYLKKNKIKSLNIKKSIEEIKSTNSNLISLIFVLEHLENPNEIFAAFKKSQAKYLFVAVPLFSFSVFIENVFPKVYPRQLGGAHTNLYTNESLNFIAKKYRLKIISEWWFGSDFSDLYRSMLTSSNYKTNIYKKKLDKFLLKNINKFQKILDESKLSSEVHLIFKKI